MENPCIFCGAPIDLKERPGRRDVCPKCGRDIHACLQCRFYDKTAYHQCREPQAEWVSDKESANFCDYFEFGREKLDSRFRGNDKTGKNGKMSARDKLEALFKKKG